MGTKRPFTEPGSPDVENGRPARQFPGPSTKRFKRDGKTKHKAKEGSIEWAKKRVRTVERLFHQRDQDLPANVRNDLDRELAAHKATISDRAFQKKRSAMISKYHMVRFFERKKAMRLAKQLRRQSEECTDPEQRESLRHDLHVAEVDEAYTLYFPHAEPYISLYGNAKPDDAEDEHGGQAAAAKAALKAERPPMWSTMETTMKQGPDALTRLRERKTPLGNEPTAKTQRIRRPPTTARPQVSKEPKQATTSKPTIGGKEGNPQLNRRERRQLMHRENANKGEDEDDGGGFFEED